MVTGPSELQVLLDKFMRRPEIGAENAINAKNSDLSMEQLLQLAKSSKNGAAFTALWNGSLEGYSSPSEADLALCSHLAFWTGRDAAKMDTMFRQSGLMRDKWGPAAIRHNVWCNHHSEGNRALPGDLHSKSGAVTSFSTYCSADATVE